MSSDIANSLRFCLNTSTIRGQNLTLPQEIDLAAKVGYQAIEPWMQEIRTYVEGGGSLPDLRKRIADSGLTVESAIGFAAWIVDDDAQRAKGLEAMRHDMETLREIGGTRIAAPPVGATDQPQLNLDRAAERYRQILELGESIGVIPQLELWGFSQCLKRLGEVFYVASEAAHDKACLLLDVYHIYKGGSDFTGLQILNGGAMHVLHMNDYPQMDRAAITDADRVYPGSGVAPIPTILKTLVDRGFRGTLSLELFNRSYWEMEAETVARTGLEAMRKLVYS